MNITIFGTSKMGSALSTRMLMGGNQVTLVVHTPDKAEALAAELKGTGKGGSISVARAGTLLGEVVILALWYPAAEDIVHQYVELLPGKILVDITNPFNFQTFEPTFPGSSGAEELAKYAPLTTKVVKAFNTTFAKTLLVDQVGGMPVDIFMAGDDADTKAKVAQLVESGGLRVIDAGPLVRARQLEALGLLHIALQAQLNSGYASSIKILT